MVNAADAPRPSCPMCVLKHLGQAAVLFQEALQGYPDHRWLAIGHMAEAEAECQAMDSEFAERIRAERVKAEREDYVPDCEDLIGKVRSMMASERNDMNVARELVKIARLLIGAEITLDDRDLRKTVEETLEYMLTTPVVSAQAWIRVFGDEYEGIIGYEVDDFDLEYKDAESISLRDFAWEFIQFADDKEGAVPDGATFKDVLRDRKLMQRIIKAISQKDGLTLDLFDVYARADDYNMTDETIGRGMTIGSHIEFELEESGLEGHIVVKGNKIVWDEAALVKEGRKIGYVEGGRRR